MLRFAPQLLPLGIALLAFAVFVLALSALATLAGRLLGPALPLLGRVLQRSWDVVMSVALAGAAALLISLIYPDASIALAAGCAVVAGVAGFAAISFGPTLFSIVSVRIGERWRSAAKLPRSGAWILGVAFIAAGLLLAIEIAADLATQRWDAPQVSAPAIKPVRPAPLAALAPKGELALRIDGVHGEAAWRLGHHDAAVRLEDASAIGAMALGPEACAAPLIVAVGAASSDGDPAANRQLALRRARWLAGWAATELASCSTPPAVLAA
ncbi:MAG: hypothetical protein ACREH4_03390 [Vitreimonas sp.]